jgi:hypothetical protein
MLDDGPSARAWSSRGIAPVPAANVLRAERCVAGLADEVIVAVLGAGAHAPPRPGRDDAAPMGADDLAAARLERRAARRPPARRICAAAARRRRSRPQSGFDPTWPGGL